MRTFISSRLLASLLLATSLSYAVPTGIHAFTASEEATPPPPVITTPPPSPYPAPPVPVGDENSPSGGTPYSQSNAQAIQVKWNHHKYNDGSSYATPDTNPHTCTLNGKPGYIATIQGSTFDHDEAGKTTGCIPYPETESTGTPESTSEESADTPHLTYAQQLAEARKKFLELDSPKPTLRFDSEDKLLNGTGVLVFNSEILHFYTRIDGAKAIYRGPMLSGEGTIEAVPVTYIYHYGDGLENSTSIVYNPGSEHQPMKDGPYGGRVPDESPSSHIFENTGNFHAYVEVVYAGRFKIGDGPWQWLPEQEVRWSDPVLVRSFVRNYYPVAKTCKEDPRARGCGQKPDWDNPNPRLRVADMRTGSKYHADASGRGDSEWRYEYSWWPYK